MNEVRLDPHKRCKDYPTIMQCSTACQNCRYNHMLETGRNSQVCQPHTIEEAARKGAPQVADPEHFTNWMERVRIHKLEEELAKRKLETK